MLGFYNETVNYKAVRIVISEIPLTVSTMTRKELISTITTLVGRYIDNFDSFDSNPQIKINPDTLHVLLVNGSDMYKSIEYSDEVIEEAAAAERSETEDATDFQAERNPDFYAVKKLLRCVTDNKVEPDEAAIEVIADIYFDK